MKIIRGKRTSAIRLVIYGTEGIGKSTLASQLPDPIIIDTEDGTSQLDAARVIALDWRAIEAAIKELIADAQGFRSVVIDSADWLEKALIEHMLKQAGKKSIEDFGYGKGYTILQEHVVRLLALIDQLIAQGINVAFVAHSKVTRTSPPDQTDGYDRYEMKLTKQVAPLLKEWADIVIFCNYRIQVVEGSDGKLKAQGGRERVMYAVHSAAWDAKNRFGLPDEMPMQFSEIAHVFPTTVKTRSEKESAASATSAAIGSDPSPATLATKDQLARLEAIKDSPGARELIEQALDWINAVSLDELTSASAASLIASIEAAVPETTPEDQVPADVAEWLDANAEKAELYLIRVKWLENGQSWRDLPSDKIKSLIERAEKFAKAAGIGPLGRKAA